MSLEMIIWIAAYFLISEICFVLAYKSEFFFFDDWILTKMSSFCFVALFFVFQVGVVFIPMDGPRYINLFYELLIIIAIIIFFSLNKLVVYFIDKK